MQWFKDHNPTIDWDAGQMVIHQEKEEDVIVEEVSDQKGTIGQCTELEITLEQLNNMETQWERRVPMVCHKNAELNLIMPTRLVQALRKEGVQLYVMHMQKQKETAETNN